ncbi:alpha-N-acetylglucosaminidase TIM-barrel domain-containing protein [[Eubacterium] hominis]|uniref:alpha-N-acetylglucosaminidase TIM-barrel domain-containing protein n=1 Tax=[Eubacterium] hominis TaxID=2764325 RepID=UPI003A4DC19E
MSKILEKGSKVILTGCVTLSMFVGQLDFLQAKKVQTNIAKDATVTVNGEDLIYGGNKEHINDGDDSTLWKSGTVEWPSTVKMKLAENSSVEKVVVKLGADDLSALGVDVEIKYAINGITDSESDWRSFAPKKEAQPMGSVVEFEASEVKSISDVMIIFSNPVILDASNPSITTESWMQVKEVEIYASQDVKLSDYNNIASQAEITTDGIGANDSQTLVDNDESSLYKFHNNAMSEEKYINLSFGEARTMDAFEIFFEHVESEPYNYAFEYSILGLKEGESEYTTLVSHQIANRTDNYTQEYTIEPAMYTDIKIVMHSCTSSAGYGWPAVAEFKVYGSEAKVEDNESIAFQKPVHTNYNRSNAASIVDGSTKTTWTGTMYPAYADIDLEENYDLSSIEIYTPTKGYTQYEIFTSMNGRDFTKLAEKDSTASCPETGEVYDATGTEARYVRVYVTYHSANANSIINEVRVMGTASGTPIQERPEINVQSYADTSYADQLANITVNDTLDEVRGIISRRLGAQYVDWFTLELGENTLGHDYDFFELTNQNGKIHIKGNNGVSLSMGLNHYLKYYCNVNISQVGDQVTMPSEVVPLKDTIFQETKAKVRYAYNYCTLSYSMPFYGEDEWRAEMDWLALNGVNVVLDATGQEEVWRRFLTKIGYDHEDIKDFIAGPAYYAWAYMANLSGFGGPVHDSWFEDRTELARKNQLSMVKLGMQPVLQGYSGMVPNDLADHDAAVADDIIKQGTWCSFQRPDMLKTDTDTYAKYAELYYASQKEVYGDVSQYYATDPFHEGGNTGDMSPETVSSEVMNNLLSFDEDAIWIIQSWQGNPTSALLNGLDGYEEHALILDLYADKTPHYNDENAYGDELEFDGKPWVFCMLNNFGGRLGLHGHLDNLANNIPEVFNTTKYVAGIGITPEASVNNPLLYDFLFETVWTSDASKDLEVIDLDSWLDDYATRRYGKESSSAQEALKILKDTVYKADLNQLGQGAPESVVNARPAFDINAASTWGNAVVSYSKGDLEEAARLMLEDYDVLKDSEGYRYDLATILQQVLSNSAQEYLKTMKAAYNSGSVEEFTKASNDFLDIIQQMEKVTSTSKYYLLGTWVNQAKNLAANTDDFSKELYELNAKSLVSTWGSISQANAGGLHDYSNRQWSGLISSYYQKRWEIWIENRKTELTNGGTVSDPDWFEWEWTWARSDEDFTSTPSDHNLNELGTYILDTFSVANPAEDDKNDIDVKTMSVETGSYQHDNDSEGDPNYVLDGNLGTMWHTDWNGSSREDQYLIFTLDEEQVISGLRYLPRMSYNNGFILEYEVLIKNSDSDNWQKVISNGTFDKSNFGWQILKFDDNKEYKAKQVKFQVIDAYSRDTNQYAALTEMRILKGNAQETADVSALNKAIEEAEKLDEKAYTAESWKAVAEALEAAKKLDANNTQKEIDTAKDALNDAMKALVEKADVNALNKAIEEAEKLDEKAYTAESWKAVAEALEAAKKLDANNTQKEIDTAKDALNNAMKALVEKADMTALNKAIEEAEKLDEKAYTAESWKAVAEALEAAKKLDESNTQKEIDTAKDALNNAVKALVKVESEPEEPVEPEKPETPENPGDSEDNGDQIGMIDSATLPITVLGSFEKGTQLNAKELSKQEVLDMNKLLSSKGLLKELTIERAFDLSLEKDGIIIQPNGTITIRINVDADLLKKDLQVIYIDDNNQITKLITRKGSDYVEFDTTHMSKYAIASKTNTTPNKDIDTGDHTNVGLAFALIMLSGAAIVILMKKRQSEE